MKTLKSHRPNYEINRGDTFEETLELKDDDGEYITEEYTWKFTVRDSLPATSTTDDTDAKISKSGTFTDGTSTLTLTSTDTDLDPREYYFDYELSIDGKKYSTFYGFLTINYDITRG
jgi:hypothetical protein